MMRAKWMFVAAAALAGCAPVIDEEGMGVDGGEVEEAEDGDGSGEIEEVGEVEVDVVGAILVSTQGAESSTEIAVLAEVTNLGVTPVTAVQLRAFAFDGYWTRSSIFENAINVETMPVEPGETVALRFAYEEAGALFDCAAWEGPAETEILLRFTAADATVEAPALANVRCRELE